MRHCKMRLSMMTLTLTIMKLHNDTLNNDIAL